MLAKLISGSFGGTNGTQWFNDVWSYDPRQLMWTQLDCIGYIPAPREGHSAALVNDVMYIFGGRTEEGTDLGDLAAFKITSRRWYTFQNMGPSPSPRSGHSMTAFGKQIVVLAGEPSSAPRDAGELSLVYILDTGKIRYPNDQQIQQTPSGERVPGNRRPSAERPARGLEAAPRAARDQSGGPDGRRMVNSSRESIVGTGPGFPPSSNPGPGSGSLPGPASRVHDMTTVSGSPVGSTSRLPRASMAQASSGPPPQQQAPPPRANGVVTPTGGPRSKTPTKDQQRGYGPPINTRNQGSFERDNMSPLKESPPQDAARSVSPMINGRRTPTQPPQQQQASMRTMTNGMDPDDVRCINGEPTRSRSRQTEQQNPLDGIDDFPTLNSQQQQQDERSFGREHEIPQGMSHLPSEINSDRSPMQAQQQQQLDNLRTQQEGLSKQLDVVRSQNAWYASELALAKKAGYQQNSSQIPLDERAFGDDEQPLIEALITMRTQLAEVQKSVDSRVSAAAQEVAEIEHQRDVAIREAAYAKAKFAAHGGTHATNAETESMSKEAGAEDRSSDFGRKLATALATQTELQATITSLTAEINAEKQTRELAESTAETAQRRVGELEQMHNPGEIERLRIELHRLESAIRGESAQRMEAHSKMELLESDKDDLSRRLNEALENTEQHTTMFGSLREAILASDEKASHFERKLDEEREQREVVDRKLLQLRAEHEERTAELEATTRKLREAEELAETNTNEARKHRSVVVGGLDKIGTRDLGASSSAAADERVIMFQQQVENAHALARKNQEDADAAAEKLRRAEERIAGLESYQEQSSREALTARKQLQEALREHQSLQTRHGEVQRNLESHQRDMSAMLVQHNALKELLEERPDRPSSRFGTPEQNRLRELEEQIEDSQRMHDETKLDFEAREQEADKMYREKLEQLEGDYQSAVHYVKGTEKMLIRMKDEMNKYKKHNELLQRELSNAQQSRSIEPEAAVEWEQERQSLRREIDEMHVGVKESVSHLERQMEEIQQELQVAQQERDQHRHDAERVQQQLALTTQHSQQARIELEQLKNENSMLESRALDAENKVTLLLDQVGNSVTNYRRQSQQMPNGHHRNLSTNSTATATTNVGDPNNAHHTGPRRGMHSQSNSIATDSGFPETSNRNSMALDSLASELETLRTHWEGHRNYRQSNQFDFERTPTSATSGGNGELSDSLASWRRRLDEEDRERSDSPQSGKGGPVLDFGKTAGVGATTVDPRVGGRPMKQEEEDKYRI